MPRDADLSDLTRNAKRRVLANCVLYGKRRGTLDRTFFPRTLCELWAVLLGALSSSVELIELWWELNHWSVCVWVTSITSCRIITAWCRLCVWFLITIDNHVLTPCQGLCHSVDEKLTKCVVLWSATSFSELQTVMITDALSWGISHQ